MAVRRVSAGAFRPARPPDAAAQTRSSTDTPDGWAASSTMPSARQAGVRTSVRVVISAGQARSIASAARTISGPSQCRRSGTPVSIMWTPSRKGRAGRDLSAPSHRELRRLV